MSLPSVRQANAFFAPLRHRTATFVVEGRQVNVQLGRIILNFASSLQWKVLVLDTDAFYATNVISFFEKRLEKHDGRVVMRIPHGDSELDDWLVDSFFEDYQVLVIDDVNTIHNLLSVEVRSANRILQFMIRTLSYLTRFENKIAILTAYKNPRESGVGRERALSLPRMGDLLVSTQLQDSYMRFTCEGGKAWIRNFFSVRI